MKYLKITFIFLIMSLLLSTYNVDAGYLGIVGIKLPALRGIYYLNGTVLKTTKSPQSYWSAGTIDNLTGEYVKVNVRTRDVLYTTSDWITVNTEQEKSWGAVDNQYPETYSLQFRRANSTLTTASHSGIWYY